MLIIDDNLPFTDLLTSALSTVDGIECVGAASSAAEGLQRVAELRPSLVLMDIMMPGLDGLSATRQLRELSPGTAVAVVSAYSQGEWIARAADAGASAYIPKGGSLREMVEVLRAARPGTMLVAPSLSSVWSAWNLPSEPVRDDCRSVPRPQVRWEETGSPGLIEAGVGLRGRRLFSLRACARERVRGISDAIDRW